jgi:hypothetical protein
VSSPLLWIIGSTRSGKTQALIDQMGRWQPLNPRSPQQPLPILIFAANGDNRLDLADRLAIAAGTYPVDTVTPQGFFQQEVRLFFPLIAAQLQLTTQFPLRLRPETEQDLATRLWRPDLDQGRLAQSGVLEYYMVRRTLDLMQIAALGGLPLEEITPMLQEGMPPEQGSPELWQCMGEVLLRWRQWCLDHGLLTYGLIAELYWRYLLPHPTYRDRLPKRYQGVMADDVDDYPAIAGDLFHTLLDLGVPGVFTFNPDSAIRWGLGADPDWLASLAERGDRQSLPLPQDTRLGLTWGAPILSWLEDPMQMIEVPPEIQSIQTISRGQLLRQVAEIILQAVQSNQVQPEEIAIIAPGVDAIARYTLRAILTSRRIEVESLNDQRPLISSALVRSLLTLLTLVYPGLGRLVSREEVAEMLVILSGIGGEGAVLAPDLDRSTAFRIDPVRAGLIVDHCFVPDLNLPHLLELTVFPRWDRIGYQAAQAYGDVTHWITTQQQQLESRLIPNAVVLLDRAIQRFFYGGSHLAYDQVTVLRELMETAQHYWEVEARRRQAGEVLTATDTLADFIRLLRDGTITANPYPVRPVGRVPRAVTLATIFQYRSSRRCHRWQFWLDASSPLWLTGGRALFGAPLFLRGWNGQTWTAEANAQAEQARLQRQVKDLLDRVGDRLYLCHSDLAINGQEQAGPLLNLVNLAQPVGVSGEEGGGSGIGQDFR